MEYNSARPKLIIPEYGRSIQKMIDHAITINDKEERNKIARAIISIMGQLNPHLRDVSDFRHKLWDHLFIISDFKLDVDSPYPKPSKETFTSKPESVNYPSRNIRYKHYGKTIEDLIKKAIEIEEGDMKDNLVESIANLMKKFYFNWNRDSVNDEVIIEQLDILSKGKLKLKDPSKLVAVDISARPRPQQQQQQKRKIQKPGFSRPKRNPHNPK